MKTISILGATGSIGCSTIDLIRQANKDKICFEIIALTANNNIDELIKLAIEFSPKVIAIGNKEKLSEIKSALSDTNVIILGGEDGVIKAASYKADMVMAAIVGIAGLKPTLEAVKNCNNLLLANKECVVSAGKFFIDFCKQSNTNLIPVDSEHNAIFQVLQNSNEVNKLIITASGGPFRNTPYEEFESLTPEMACKHPKWDMGQKISVDSASLMNKALELIEASFLFDIEENKIDVLVHPQSIIHSMVEYRDGSILAQLGMPDMRIPISYAMNYPSRMDFNSPKLDFITNNSLDFFAPDNYKFPALNIARRVLNIGGSATCVFNAANETAVQYFLNQKINFKQISQLVEETVNYFESNSLFTQIVNIEDVFEADSLARQIAINIISES